VADGFGLADVPERKVMGGVDAARSVMLMVVLVGA